ncbi:MAG: hypothetical protein AB7H86_14320 [Blastocatellales bacterium]
MIIIPRGDGIRRDSTGDENKFARKNRISRLTCRRYAETESKIPEKFPAIAAKHSGTQVFRILTPKRQDSQDGSIDIIAPVSSVATFSWSSVLGHLGSLASRGLGLPGFLASKSKDIYVPKY